jgi:hypothetical protein
MLVLVNCLSNGKITHVSEYTSDISLTSFAYSIGLYLAPDYISNAEYLSNDNISYVVDTDIVKVFGKSRYGLAIIEAAKIFERDNKINKILA